MKIINGDCLEYLRRCDKYDMIWMDPPDNLGLKYDNYDDKLSAETYYGWLEVLMWNALCKCNVFWLSYYWSHDIEIKGRLRSMMKGRFQAHSGKTFIWRYTFGQHRATDFGSGFRYLLRVNSPVWKPVELPRVESERQRIGDTRACAEGRVPDDVWDMPIIQDVPRVVGNAKERRAWHPTQHPEALMERVIISSVSRGGTILDCFLGTGTTMRVASRMERDCDGCEISDNYANRAGLDMGVPVVRWGDGLA
jgi:DNA modification methylase